VSDEAIRPYKHVAVLYGGPSPERDVSLDSGRAVVRGLLASGYTVSEIDVVGRDVVFPADVDAAFIALHGEFGEDGAVQTILESRGMPYTGSGPEASRLAFDKRESKARFESAGVRTPAYECLAGTEGRTLALPVVVKPPCQGSTIGVHIVREEADWVAAVEDALRYDTEIICETYIPGRELTVGILGHDALPVVEIKARDGWYDYDAKYTAGLTEYVVPAPLSAEQADACHALACDAYDSLGCRGFGRVDLREAPDGAFHVLEVNTIPGFTETSLLPMAAAESGMDFVALCDTIARSAGCAGTMEVEHAV